MEKCIEIVELITDCCAKLFEKTFVVVKSVLEKEKTENVFKTLYSSTQ